MCTRLQLRIFAWLTFAILFFVNLLLLYFDHNYIIFYETAPGQYDIEKAEKTIHHQSGAVTFGIKYKDQKPDDIPGTFHLFLLCYKLFCVLVFNCKELGK